MAFKDKLIDKLKLKGVEFDYDLLPKGFQRVGHLIILNLREELADYYSYIGKCVVELFSGVDVVCVKTGEIVGEFRRPQLKVIFGSGDLKVENYENGVWFCYDAGKIMFAKGNVNERGRLARIVSDGEVIVDMFIGIGYFSLPIAKKNKSVKIYGIDKNEDSVFWLKRSILKNKINNIEVFRGDSREVVLELIEKGVVADRVLMGYLPPPEQFVGAALSILRDGGVVHYDALIRVEHVKEDLEKVKELFEREEGVRAEIINPQRVKSYGPKVDHYVVDLRIFKN